MDQQAIRIAIPATSNVVYMNTGWSGPSPSAVVEAVSARLREESALGPASPTVLASGARAPAGAAGVAGGLPERLGGGAGADAEHNGGPEHGHQRPGVAAGRRGDHVQPGAQLGAGAVLVPATAARDGDEGAAPGAGRGPRQHRGEGGGGDHAPDEAAVHEPRAVQERAADAGGAAARGDAAARRADAPRRSAGDGPRAAGPARAGRRLLRDAGAQVDAGAGRRRRAVHPAGDESSR